MKEYVSTNYALKKELKKATGGKMDTRIQMEIGFGIVLTMVNHPRIKQSIPNLITLHVGILAILYDSQTVYQPLLPSPTRGLEKEMEKEKEEEKVKEKEEEKVKEKDEVEEKEKEKGKEVIVCLSVHKKLRNLLLNLSTFFPIPMYLHGKSAVSM